MAGRRGKYFFHMPPFSFIHLMPGEKIWDGNAYGNTDNNKDCFYAGLNGEHQTAGAKVFDIDKGKENAVEQHAGNQRNDRWNTEHMGRDVKSPAGVQGHKTDRRRADEGTGNRTAAKFQIEKISQADA